MFALKPIELNRLHYRLQLIDQYLHVFAESVYELNRNSYSIIWIHEISFPK